MFSIASLRAHAVEPVDIESDLAITVDGRSAMPVSMRRWRCSTSRRVSLALIDEDRIAFARAYGAGATPDTLYQAASLSKFVTAVGAMRLVEAGSSTSMRMSTRRLTSWRVPANEFDKDHPVTLRGLLSMTAASASPAFPATRSVRRFPTLTQILDGMPPANSPPVTVIAVPGSAYHYSGGGYEIVEALVQDVGQCPSRKSWKTSCSSRPA